MDMILTTTKVEFDRCNFTQNTSLSQLNTMIEVEGKDFVQAFMTKNCVFRGLKGLQTSEQIFKLQNVRYEDIGSDFGYLNSAIFTLDGCRVDMRNTTISYVKSPRSLI